MPRGREDLLERLPEAERTVAGREFGRDRETPRFQSISSSRQLWALSRTPT
jgi:hypothetical protein